MSEGTRKDVSRGADAEKVPAAVGDRQDCEDTRHGNGAKRRRERLVIACGNVNQVSKHGDLIVPECRPTFVGFHDKEDNSGKSCHTTSALSFAVSSGENEH